MVVHLIKNEVVMQNHHFSTRTTWWAKRICFLEQIIELS